MTKAAPATPPLVFPSSPGRVCPLPGLVCSGAGEVGKVPPPGVRSKAQPLIGSGAFVRDGKEIFPVHDCCAVP